MTGRGSYSVGPRFFRAIGIPILGGRSIEEEESGTVGGERWDSMAGIRWADNEGTL
jgi:hypothetical protein